MIEVSQDVLGCLWAFSKILLILLNSSTSTSSEEGVGTAGILELGELRVAGEAEFILELIGGVAEVAGEAVKVSSLLI